MTYEEIFELVDAEPFRPFRVQIASGRTFKFRHPRNIRVGEHSVAVFEFREEDEHLFEKHQMSGLSRLGRSNLSKTRSRTTKRK